MIHSKKLHRLGIFTLLLGAGFALSSESRASAITLINQSDSHQVEFQLYQGVDRIARVGVQGGGTAEVATSTMFDVSAATLDGEFVLESNAVSFDGAGQLLVAQVLNENGFYDFQLAAERRENTCAITLQNTWSSPVQFKLTRPNSPVQFVTVVEAHQSFDFVPPPTIFTVFAVVNGIVSGSVSVTDPNGRITAIPNNSDDGVTLRVN